MALNRISRAYLIIGKTFNSWFSPIIAGFLITFLRLIVGIGRILDHVFFWSIRKNLDSPIVIVGNPRSGTTFLHRFLIKQGIGTGSQLWQMIYPSIFIQKCIKPILPLMEIISPARHHSTEAHKTSLTSIETDDVSLFFRYLDGFFFYGFFLTFDEEDLFHWVDPKIRDTSARDFAWFESMWKRNLRLNKGERYIGKLFNKFSRAYLSLLPSHSIIIKKAIKTKIINKVNIELNQLELIFIFNLSNILFPENSILK